MKGSPTNGSANCRSCVQFVTVVGDFKRVKGHQNFPVTSPLPKKRVPAPYWQQCIEGAWQVPAACLQFAVYRAHTTCNELRNESARVERRSKEPPAGGAPPTRHRTAQSATEAPTPASHLAALFHVHLIVASIRQSQAPESMQPAINPMRKIITCNCGRHKA